MTKLYNLIQILLIAIVSFVVTQSTTAEDTEIYQTNALSKTTGRPKVLVVFDNSGSMDEDVITNNEDYNPDTPYDGDFLPDRIYWRESGRTPYDNRWTRVSRNNCAESITPLKTVGFFQGKIQYFRNEYWRTPDRNRDDYIIDCEADMIAVPPNSANPGTNVVGFPNERDSNGYTGNIDDATINWKSTIYLLYTGNYLNWYFSDDAGGGILKTRMEIAQTAIKNLIIANPGVDFGLMLFNRNYDSASDGGRLINKIIEGSGESERDAMIANIDAFKSSGNTPLCETTYEAYRYLSGGNIRFADEAHDDDTPDRDKTAEDGDSYISPSVDCKELNIILMTDGLPTKDTNANSDIKSDIGMTGNCSDHETGTENCLPELINFMAVKDLDNDSTNDIQRITTHTIAFGISAPILEATEKACEKCTYTEAKDADTLRDALTAAINAILESNESFTSPAVAVDTFSRTESRNEVFFAMFKPSENVDWRGNVKKLEIKIDKDSGVATLIDADKENAINPKTTRIKDTARTLWSYEADGDNVEQGGAGALLAAKNPSTRNIKTNIGTDTDDDFDDSLEDFTIVNMKDPEAFGFIDTDFAGLYDFFGVANDSDEIDDEALFDTTIKWAQGYDIGNSMDGFDADTNYDIREWILGDMLHSRPVVVNYGGSDKDNPDQRIIVGTNAGFLHMFGDADGEEDWAFFPKELAPILIKRRMNAASEEHVYGIDAPPVVYTYDANRDGTISKTDGDKAYIYFGLRRGGRAMYALDISDPDNPEFLWKINNSTTGFSELGQTWSVPVITTIPGITYDHDGDGSSGDATPEIPKPVLVFGAGYDENKDTTGVGASDSMGRGVFIIDAFTGEKIWSYTSLDHSVPSAITPMDSNGDEIADRLYFGDTGGNVWRVDMPGDDIGITIPWSITKLADLNSGTTATDRRFFNAPDVVRTKRKVCTAVFPDDHDLAGECKIASIINYDAVMIGSGDRTNPNATDVGNQFYMIRDRQLAPYITDRLGSKINSCSDENKLKDFRCYLPLNTTDLYDATSNIIQTGSDTLQDAANKALESAHGWRLDLSGSGEKSLSRSVTIFGSIYFTTFTPDDGLTVSCVPLAGKGLLYQVDLHDATAKRHFDNDGFLDRTIGLGSLIPDTPAPHFGSDKKIRLLFPSGGGPIDGSPLDTGAEMPQPYGIYWYREEL